jgi:hypothetical protein
MNALFRWTRVQAVEEVEEELRVKKVVWAADMVNDRQGMPVELLVKGSMECVVCDSEAGRRVCKPTSGHRDGVKESRLRMEAMEEEIGGVRRALIEMTLLVEESIRGTQSRATARNEGALEGEGAGAKVPVERSAQERRGSVRTVRHGEVLIRASGVGVGGVLLAMRRSGMMVRGAEGWQDKLGVRLRVRLREGQTVRGWAQEWKWKVMGRSRVPWRCVVSPRVCGGHETVGRHD